MESEICTECGDEMINIIRADSTSDEPVLFCNQCGFSANKERDDALQFDHNVEEGGSSWGHHTGGVGESAPAGYKYEKFRITKARIRGKDMIQRLCSNFCTPSLLKKETFSQFEKMKSRKLDAAAAAAFLFVVRLHHSENSAQGVLTLRQVATVAGLPIKDIAASLKLIKHSETTNCGSITNISSLMKSVLPQFELFDPFTCENITKRVLNLTERIVELVQMRSTKNVDPNFITVAACLLSWQSCFFYQREYHENAPPETINQALKMSTLPEFLQMIKFNADANLKRSIQKSLNHVLGELGLLLEKMPWIGEKYLKQPLNKMVPKFLHEILRFQGYSCEILSKEEELKRQMAKPDPPVKIPKKLTVEEEAILNRPELSDVDLPEDEISNYIRSPKEVAVLRQWIEESSQHK